MLLSKISSKEYSDQEFLSKSLETMVYPWIGLFNTIIQTNPKFLLDIKKLTIRVNLLFSLVYWHSYKRSSKIFFTAYSISHTSRLETYTIRITLIYWYCYFQQENWVHRRWRKPNWRERISLWKRNWVRWRGWNIWSWRINNWAYWPYYWFTEK